KRAGGLQLLTNDEKTFVTRPIYNVEITQSSPNVFSKTTKEVNYEYWDRGIQIGKISSDDIKTLGAKSSSAVTVNCGGWAWTWLRAFSLVNSSCSLEIDQDKLIQLVNQPVVVKITMKDATLMDVRVPAVASNENLISIIKIEKPYYIIKKVKVEVLEAPEDNNTALYYEEMVREQFNWANKVYNDKTAKVLPPAAVAAGAEMANARIVFKDIDISIRKASKKAYNADKIQKEGRDGEISAKEFNKREVFIKYVPKIINNIDDDMAAYTIRWEDVKSNLLAFSLMLLDYNTSDDPPHIQRRSAPAHELGHYFSLKHTFEGGCTKVNDKISDTPPAELITYPLTFKNCIAPVQCGGNRRLIENIMDYGNCRFMFTPGQVRVMRATIRNDYPDLYTIEKSTDAAINTDLNITVKDLRSGKTGRSKR
ncbi:M43 family zinc metalloprotease, partial [Flavobacterium sp. UGB4466]|uniref:M43 family zinc metalloprotease n=1 Tax=Flavobacterium sp. UGB4466 TaxID=2730889 RepID=UPI002102BB33